MLAEDGETSHGDLVRAFPEALPSSVSVSLMRMCRGGRIEQARRGYYRLPREPAEGHVPTDDASAAIHAMRPGEAFDTAGLTDRTGVSYQVAQGVIARMLRAGVIERRVRGVYARVGAPARMGMVAMPLYDEMLGIMARRDAPWTVTEVRAALPGDAARTAASHTLCNMRKAGLVERVGHAAYALTPKGVARTARPVSEDPAEAALAVLRRGGLWRARDVAPALGCEPASVDLMLRRLEAAGRAVHVIHGEWRAHDVPVDLAVDGHTQGVVLLGRVMAAPGRVLTSVDHGRLYGGPTGHLAPEFFDLQVAGYVERRGYGVRAMAPHWAAALASRLAVAPPRPPLTPLGARMVESLRDAPPQRKVDIAARLGTGRGVAIRMVDRLVAEGRMVEVGVGAYMIG
jgi:DNA-binding MarR family transcriptional regulator